MVKIVDGKIVADDSPEANPHEQDIRTISSSNSADTTQSPISQTNPASGGVLASLTSMRGLQIAMLLFLAFFLFGMGGSRSRNVGTKNENINGRLNSTIGDIKHRRMYEEDVSHVGSGVVVLILMVTFFLGLYFYSKKQVATTGAVLWLPAGQANVPGVSTSVNSNTRQPTHIAGGRPSIRTISDFSSNA